MNLISYLIPQCHSVQWIVKKKKTPHRLSCVWILNCDFKKFTSGRNTLESVKAHRIFLERSYRLNAN